MTRPNSERTPSLLEAANDPMDPVVDGSGLLYRLMVLRPALREIQRSLPEPPPVSRTTGRGSRKLAPALQLSKRELEVLALLAAGGSNKQIADSLSLSQATVATHLRRVYARLGVHSRTQVLAKMRSLGREL